MGHRRTTPTEVDCSADDFADTPIAGLSVETASDSFDIVMLGRRKHR
jgi:hypothetical protein